MEVHEGGAASSGEVAMITHKLPVTFTIEADTREEAIALFESLSKIKRWEDGYGGENSIDLHRYTLTRGYDDECRDY